MREIWDFPITETGWPELSGVDWFYIPFNLLEAVAWFGFAFFVVLRWWRNRKTWYEVIYALAFVLFGISDLFEVNGLTVGLLLFKAGTLAAILAARRVTIDRYPGARF